MAPKSKLILIMAALSLGNKKICALALCLTKWRMNTQAEDFG